MVLVLLGLALRLVYSLRSSLYVDEFTTIWAARQALAHGLPWLPSGVLYTRGLLSVWLQATFVPLLGDGEWAARVPSLLVSTVTLPLFYQLGRRLFGPVAAIVATATLALFPDAIVWGGRARFYALFHLLIVVQLLAFWHGFVMPPRDASKKEGRRARWAWLLLVAAGLWTAEQTLLLLPAFGLGIVLWRGPRWLRTREALALEGGLAGFLLARLGFEVMGQPGQLTVIQESRPYVSLFADIGGALRAYASFFLAPEQLGLTVAALAGLALLWGGRRALASSHRRAGRLDALLLAELLLWLPLIAMVVSAGPAWRDQRYLFILIPSLALLGAALVERLLAHWGPLPRGGGASASPGIQRVWLPSLTTLVALVLPFVFFARPAAATVESQVEGYDLAFRYIQSQRQPGDAIISPQPPACAVYFGPCQGYAISSGWEAFVVRRDGQFIDRWTGAPLIRNQAELRAMLERWPRIWMVLDSLRAATRYDPRLIGDLARLGTVAWTGRGVLVLRLDGWQEPPAFSVHGEPAARFEGGAELVAFDFAPPSAEDLHERLMPLQLHWTAAAPLAASTVFVHLTAADHTLVAQDDGLPARGLLPTFLWGDEHPVPDPHVLTIPAGAAGWHRLTAGLYDSTTHVARRLLDGSGHPAAEAVTLAYVWLGPVPAAPARPLEADFGGRIALQGTELPGSVVTTPGTALEIPVLWQSLRPAGQDLTVFVHLVGTDGTPLVQADRQPTGGFFPTGRWRPGDRVPDTITLTLPSGLPAGEYRLLVGLYDVSTGARLSLPDGTDAFVLATLRVEAAS
ncbi:MAG: glycosyltransferase family 39 protein [Ardenticatenaceae bacterium]|nr:glycosyltransferase family 39 protein [Ardenticatenaceae bacterium]